jgi:hypothetical protein
MPRTVKKPVNAENYWYDYVVKRKCSDILNAVRNNGFAIIKNGNNHTGEKLNEEENYTTYDE